MASFDLTRRLTAEALGTALLVAAVIGSGIMAADWAASMSLKCQKRTLAMTPGPVLGGRRPFFALIRW
jgi:glycerol uptake facilitator-like aquaporin